MTTELTDEQLNVFCAERVMGFPRHPNRSGGWLIHSEVVAETFRPCARSYDAFTVLKKCAEKYGCCYVISVGISTKGKWEVCGHPRIRVEAPTLELAIALFAYRLYGGGE